MSELFIPPAGAMQFLCERNYLGEPLKREPFAVWVKGTSPRTCASGLHKHMYRVIVESLPARERKPGQAMVCECAGQVIE